MRQRDILICIFLFSFVIMMIKWNKEAKYIIHRMHLMSNPTLESTPSPIVRQSVTLNDSTYQYHLNLTSFEAEFPHLQSYHCAIIEKLQPQGPLEGNQKLVILAIKSHPGQGTRRAALRQTWATERVIDAYRFRPLFLLGMTSVNGQMEIVKQESRVYGDILQWDMMEGHHNLSLKERCFLEWLHLNLPQAYYIFKGDDDEFVNPEMIGRYITEHGTPHTIHGYYQHRPGVMRRTKYQISKTLYPQEKYPGFVSGGGFLYPGAAVKSLYEASQRLPVFPLDDVYFGFLALAANMTFRPDPRFIVYRLKFDACKYKQMLVVHGVSYKDMVNVWQEVQNADCRSA